MGCTEWGISSHLIIKRYCHLAAHNLYIGDNMNDFNPGDLTVKIKLKHPVRFYLATSLVNILTWTINKLYRLSNELDYRRTKWIVIEESKE